MLQQLIPVAVDSFASALVGALGTGLVVLVVALLRPWRLLRWMGSLGSRRAALEQAEVAMTEAAERTSALGVVVDRLREQVANEQRRANELFERIDGVLKERDKWRDLYFEQATQHGAAQELLFNELQAMANRLRKAGVDPTPNPRLQAVMAAFRDEHLSGPAKIAEKA